MSAKIYIEGGGDGALQDTLFRKAWREFFKAAGLEGRMPAPVRGQGRKQTFDDFVTAVKAAKPGEVPILLVDAEDAVAPGLSVWQHLKSRDGWQQPTGTTENQAFLMARVMETWLVADAELLARYFGSDYRPKHVPTWPVLEDVDKKTVLGALDRATAGCRKRYAKGKISFELLASLNPTRVEGKCPHGKRLLDQLRSM